MSSKNNKIESFKQSISSTLKAISKNKNLNVQFGNQEEKKDSNQVNLPLPSIQLEDMEKNEIRGLADSIALKFKNHNTEIHNSIKPKSKNGNNIFNSIEAARYESLGIIEYKGIKNNIKNNIIKKYKKTNLSKNLKKEEVAFEDAVQIIMQEKLTNQKLPNELKQISNAWRDDLEPIIKENIDDLNLEAAVHYGGILSPFNAWLISRGAATLPIRMKAHEDNAKVVVDFLKDHSKGQGYKARFHPPDIRPGTFSNNAGPYHRHQLIDIPRPGDDRHLPETQYELMPDGIALWLFDDYRF